MNWPLDFPVSLGGSNFDIKEGLRVNLMISRQEKCLILGTFLGLTCHNYSQCTQTVDICHYMQWIIIILVQTLQKRELLNPKNSFWNLFLKYHNFLGLHAYFYMSVLYRLIISLYFRYLRCNWRNLTLINFYNFQ